MPADLVIRGATQLVTCREGASDRVGIVASGCIAVRDGIITAVGQWNDLAQHVGPATSLLEAQGGTITPGLIDCHTHLIFEGDRSDEYYHRTRGLDDADLTAAGIVWGVPASRAANRGRTARELAAASLPRALDMLSAGTTTIETKSGYGLDFESDIASLEAAHLIADATGLDIVGTYLGAHTRPAEHADRYIDEMVDKTIPAIADMGLAEFCDVYVDPHVFTLAECQRVLSAAADHKLTAKLHTDARTNIGGARLAAEMQAASVDHGNMLTDDDLRILADVGTVVAFFPGFDFAVAHPHPVDGRRLVHSGATVALATDLCPVCWHLSQQMSMGFACRLSGLTPEEALLGVTINAAKALRRERAIGSIVVGKQADLVIFDVPDYRQLPFRFGVRSARTVVKKGRILIDKSLHRISDAGACLIST
jgi:imidazolonepropionase